ncbi:hypothetical protein HF086_002501, partial [Spodoptera exigua]
RTAPNKRLQLVFNLNTNFPRLPPEWILERTMTGSGRLHNVSRYQVVVILAVLVTSLPPSTGYIDCRISCRRCHENTEHPSVLEVYCAMCEECKQRRRERYLLRLKGRPTSARTTLIRMRDGVEEITKTPPLGPQAAAHPPEHLQQARQRQAVPSEYPAPSGHPGQPGQAPLPLFMQQQPHPQLLQQEPGPELLKTFHEKPRPIQRGYGPEYGKTDDYLFQIWKVLGKKVFK